MRRLISCTLLLLLLPLALPASEFDWMVREFARQSGVQQMHIPFLGLARFTVAVARPAGTSDFKLAIFEHPHMQGGEFSQMTDSLIGAAWKPIIRVRSRNSESTNFYVQPNGKYLRLLIATIDSGDATFIELRLKPESLMKFVDEHKHGHQAW